MQSTLTMSGLVTGFDGHLQTLLLIMLLTGILGGYANYFLRDRSLPARDKDWVRYPVLGLVAALCVPLVLSTLSSNLLDAGRVHSSDYYVFAAFCLFFVVLTRRLFDSIGGRLGDHVEKLQREIGHLKQGVERLQKAPAPAALVQESAEAAKPAAEAPAAETKKEALTHADVELMRAIASDNIVYGNLADLVSRTGVSRELAGQRVATLKSWGAIESRMNDKQTLQWVVTPKGKQMLADLIN